MADFFDLTDALSWLAYVLGFWLFFLSPAFRRRVVQRWRQREGIEHLHTAFEIGLSTACAAITVWGIWSTTFGAPPLEPAAA